MLEILRKRTIDLSEKEIIDIYSLFEIVFHKKRNVCSFHEQFENTSKGYSYHAIAVENGKIVGHNVYLPFTYLYNETPFLLCLSVDAMIHPEYRGRGLYRQLLEACEDMAVSDGCVLRIGFPNDISYPLQVNKFKYNDVGKLDTYMLPINIGMLNPKLKFLNFITRGLSSVVCFLSKKKFVDSTHRYLYRKDRKNFDNVRYKWFGANYQIKTAGDIKYVYKDSIFKGKRATFILDVYPLTRQNFDRCVREVFAEKKNETPIIIYVGNLYFIPLSMFKIPHWLEPKHFHFVSKFLIPDRVSEDSLNINNWELNLSNYDLI